MNVCKPGRCVALRAVVSGLVLVGLGSGPLPAQDSATLDGRQYVREQGTWFLEYDGTRFRVEPDAGRVGDAIDSVETRDDRSRLDCGLFAQILDAGRPRLLGIARSIQYGLGIGSEHAAVGELSEAPGAAAIDLGPDTCTSVVAPTRTERAIVVERLY